MRPLHILDLYCGAGGAAMGYAQAGFVVTGVDIVKHRYPFRFIHADALEVLDNLDVERYHAIHASPPCQRFTRNARQRGTAESHPDLIAPTRDRLRTLGLPYVIENVELAPLVDPLMLCGVMFNLGVFRHRGFELSWRQDLQLDHPPHPGHVGDGRYYTVAGHTGWNSTRDGRIGGTVGHWRWAMGIGWMSSYELAEAVPPAYTRYIGEHLNAHLRGNARAA